MDAKVSSTISHAVSTGARAFVVVPLMIYAIIHFRRCKQCMDQGGPCHALRFLCSYQDLVANFQCREGRDRGITDASIGGHDFQHIACQQCPNLSLQVLGEKLSFV